MKKLFLILVIHSSIFITVCFAQLSRTNNYMSQQNLLLPGNTAYRSPHPQFNSDSIFPWSYVQTQLIYAISDIFFIDSLFGWASHGNGGVLRTSNSGFNWDTTQLVPSAGGPCNGVHFIDRSTGWTVGIMGMIRKTTNGGINWTNQDYLIYDAYYKSVHFFDQYTGVVTGIKFLSNGHEGYVVKTTNGGDNWNEMYIDTGQYTQLWRQFWINIDTGWFCGYNMLLKTNDCGVTYINYFSNVPPTQNGVNIFGDIYFINEQTGWLASGADWKNIYKTTNAGLNWFFQDNPVAQHYFDQINGIIFISPDTGWASSYVGLIIVTTNGGTNWYIDYMDDESTRFSKYGKSKVWCGGVGGKIYYSNLTNPVGIIKINNKPPCSYSLFQNFPNPFNPTTKIKFDIPKNEFVTIKIYNSIGKEICTILKERKSSGSYTVSFDGSNLPSGVYFYRFQTDNYSEAKKMVLIK